MDDQELSALMERLNKGLEASYEALLRKKAMLGQSVIISDGAGNPIEVSAKEVLAKYLADKKITSTMEKYDELEQYIRSQEPDTKERAAMWQTAIGMQKVDGLTVSDYLVDTAQKHIEKQVDINEAKSLIAEYYQTADRRETISNDEEADKAAVNIVQVLSEQAFSFSVEGLAGLHRRIFQGIFKHAGEFRKYNITKKEWVLDGDTVIYGPCEDLRQTIQYDLDQEKQFRYKGLTMDASIDHFAAFIAGLWQIHPFAEGNTRTTAVFAIKYLRAIGVKVENDMFKEHSWYFRNALVRANYRNMAKGVDPDISYLVLFFRNLLLGETNDLKNRNLHIRADELPTPQQ